MYKDHPLLASDSLRLITLHPSGSDAAIEASVKTVDLSLKPTFFALSYTWGNPVHERHPYHREYDAVKYHISCDGEIVIVQQNLYEALWQLREEQIYSPLWIDAICINQNDGKERNHQLSLMPRIYCDASWVIIWLGKDDATTCDAVQCLDSFQHDLVMGSMVNCQDVAKLLRSIPNRQKQALNLLFRRRWFTRVWTLQEVLLPTRTRCLCGPYQLDIEAACLLAALSLRVISSDRATAGLFEDLDELLISQLGSASCVIAWHGTTGPAGGFGSRALLRYPEIDYKMEIPRTVKWLVALELFVHEARHRNCSKLEDKILAPLAFALHEQFTPDTSDYIPLRRNVRRIIDCQIPVTELYLKFTRFMIDSMANLDILSRAHRDFPLNDATEELDLPSWVPRFHEAGRTSLIDDILFSQYNAAAHLGPYEAIEPSAEISELSVRAIFFARIVQISNYSAPANSPTEWLNYVHKSERFKQEVASSNCGDLAHAVTRALGDRLNELIKRNAEAQKRRDEYLRSISSVVGLIQAKTPVGVEAARAVLNSYGVVIREGLTSSQQVSRRNIRKLFRFDIRGQRLIGVAPAASQESDHLCILQGAKVPFVIRETLVAGRYMLVGEVFAENFMHGELRCLNFSDKVIILV
ncbi:hypothetical protein FOMA001_g20262 [Fusarium oxysporum f. sp. matthiolae]|nr:hypothetical protein FOMA001_g20262 [Fusarium oxysporum f. sp. matthiolae]